MKATKATREGLLATPPFNRLSDTTKAELANAISVHEFEEGERLCREDELPTYDHLVIKGSVRLLTKSTRSEELITISKRGKGQYIGWVSLLRGDACETVQAMENTTVVSISGETFIKACLEETKFLEYFNTTTSVHESWKVLSKN